MPDVAPMNEAEMLVNDGREPGSAIESAVSEGRESAPSVSGVMLLVPAEVPEARPNDRTPLRIFC